MAHRMADRAWREANPEKKKESNARWYQANKERHLAYMRKYRRSHPKMTQTHEAYVSLLQQGKVHRSPCCVTGERENVDAHFTVYDPEDPKPIYLCRRLHKRLHSAIEEVTRGERTTEYPDVCVYNSDWITTMAFMREQGIV